MSSGGARDSRFDDAVDGASGAAAFDGNHTNDLMSWLLPNEDWGDHTIREAIEQLIEWTVRGHLAWMILPPRGFRV